MTGPSSTLLRLEAALDFVRAACIFFASIALIVLVFTFGWLVFGRYVLNVTPTWVEQLALLLVCYIAFLGAAAGVKENFHLGVTLFRDLMPQTVQKLVIICIDFGLATFGIIMLIAGITLMKFGWSTMLPMLDVPESYRTLAITSCGALVSLFAGLRGIVRVFTFSDWQPVDQTLDS